MKYLNGRLVKLKLRSTDAGRKERRWRRFGTVYQDHRSRACRRKELNYPRGRRGNHPPR